jgi:hypothetical protein
MVIYHKLEKQARLNAQMNSLSSELHEIVLPT